MRLLRSLVLALALSSTTASSAWAQALTMTVGNPEWTPSTGIINQVNRRDCLTPDLRINFAVSFAGGDLTSRNLEVWSGSDCATQTNRDKNTNCVPVYSAAAANTTVSVKVQDILQRAGVDGLGVNTGTDATCDDAGGSAEATKRILWFLVLDPSALSTAIASAQWPFTFDVTPPEAPTDATAGAGEDSLVISFTGPSVGDLARYHAYCSADAGGCTSAELQPGMEPSQGDCGNTNSTGTSKVTARGLTNGTSFAVAVAAEDKLGNIGKLSNLACGVPQEVTGYYEAYRAAGGEGGGGFCSFSPPRRGSLVALGCLTVAGLALLRRRR